MLAFIRRAFDRRSWVIKLQSCKSLLWPQLENYVPWLENSGHQDVIKLEGVQKRFTGMLPGQKGLNYKKGLDRMGLFFLEQRRTKSDIVEVYKIMKGINRMGSHVLFP